MLSLQRANHAPIVSVAAGVAIEIVIGILAITLDEVIVNDSSVAYYVYFVILGFGMLIAAFVAGNLRVRLEPARHTNRAGRGAVSAIATLVLFMFVIEVTEPITGVDVPTVFLFYAPGSAALLIAASALGHGIVGALGGISTGR